MVKRTFNLDYNYIKKSGLHYNIIRLAAIFIAHDLLKKLASISDEKLQNYHKIKEEILKYFSKDKNPNRQEIRNIVNIEENMVSEIQELEKQLKYLKNLLSEKNLKLLELGDENLDSHEYKTLKNDISKLKNEIKKTEQNLQKLREDRRRGRKHWFDYYFSKFLEPIALQILLQESKEESELKMEKLNKRLKDKPYLLEIDNEYKELLENKNTKNHLTFKSLVSKVKRLIGRIKPIVDELSKEINKQLSEEEKEKIENLYNFFKTSLIIFENIQEDIEKGNLYNIENVIKGPNKYEYQYLSEDSNILRKQREKLDELIELIDSEVKQTITNFSALKDIIEKNQGIIGYTIITIPKSLISKRNEIDFSILPSNIGTEWSAIKEQATEDIYTTSKSDLFSTSYLELKIQKDEQLLNSLKKELDELQNKPNKTINDDNKIIELKDKINQLETEIQIDKSILDEYTQEPIYKYDDETEPSFTYLIKAFLPKKSIDWEKMEEEYDRNFTLNEIYVKPNSILYLLDIEKVNIENDNEKEVVVKDIRKKILAYQTRYYIF